MLALSCNIGMKQPPDRPCRAFLPNATHLAHRHAFACIRMLALKSAPSISRPSLHCPAAAMQTMQARSTCQAAALLLESQVVAAGGARLPMLDMGGPLDTSQVSGLGFRV